MLTENLSFPVAPNDLQAAIAQEPWYASLVWQNERSSFGNSMRSILKILLKSTVICFESCQK